MNADAFPFIDITKAFLQKLHHESFRLREIEVEVLRLDVIHAQISGNKWFKLKYHLQRVLDSGRKGIVTFGGAYSNHLLATAAACKHAGLPCKAFVRGELSSTPSRTILDCRDLGMELVFVSREKFRNPDLLIQEYCHELTGYHIVPEGGCSVEGVNGSAEILSLINKDMFDYFICSVGTGTMMKGIVQGTGPSQITVGISSLKIADLRESKIMSFLNENSRTNFDLVVNYHFGGYGKHTRQLTEFMNAFYVGSGIPTDIIYTGKLFFGLMDLIQKDYFPRHARICVIHSGGLQGNRSLPDDTLCY